MTNNNINTFTKFAVATSGVVFGLAALEVPAKAAVFNLGSLSNDGTSLVQAGADAGNGNLDFFNFTLDDDIDNINDWLNIATNTLNNNDTDIGLYDANGFKVAEDDDGGPLFDSELSFGGADPLAAPDKTPGVDGTLLAGDYTLVVSGWNANFTTNINDIVAGTQDLPTSYTLTITNFDDDIQSTPEPTGILGFLAMGAFGWLSGLKRKLKGE
ncbi:MAG: PEP-CTERM sorting domain-containing protein [Okeania sp. SIO2C9]|uniref:PEP-CTERM sorting domain-containing protein n=1 Tax=Okeania sp. SIO2C9 TaxID=2607791 RepID=UPI0013C0C63E|nr:PEP-CTERM sorting domain-containing protein [Okeania sp. SIO2C9]NEQ77973.1 PEP-CTERM sorting domain-containing protein [Okeania sp. SIO2C9]